MARREITQEMYGAMLVAFRERPGNAMFAARAAKVHRATATRAWKVGWPKLGWAAPIQQVIAGEQKQARAKLAEEQAKAATAAAQAEAAKVVGSQEAAKHDALDARVKETQLVRLARENTVAVLGMSQRLLRGGLKSIDHAEAAIIKAIQSGKLTAGQVIRYYGSLGKLQREAAECGKLAMHLERQLVGAPTEIIGIGVVNLADAEREAREALEMIEEAKAAGLIPSGEGTPDGDLVN